MAKYNKKIKHFVYLESIFVKYPLCWFAHHHFFFWLRLILCMMSTFDLNDFQNVVAQILPFLNICYTFELPTDKPNPTS